MNPKQSEAAASDAEAEARAAEFHRLASHLDVYQRERLADTERPARQPKSKHPASPRVKKFFAAVSCWVISRC